MATSRTGLLPAITNYKNADSSLVEGDRNRRRSQQTSYTVIPRSPNRDNPPSRRFLDSYSNLGLGGGGGTGGTSSGGSYTARNYTLNSDPLKSNNNSASTFTTKLNAFGSGSNLNTLGYGTGSSSSLYGLGGVDFSTSPMKTSVTQLGPNTTLTVRESYLDREKTRIDQMEERLDEQEQKSRNMLQEALRVKEELISNLDITHYTWQEEKRARELLNMHIQGITDIVMQLNKDIALLQDQINNGGQVSKSNLDVTIRKLENQQSSVLNDLVGRLATNDAAIKRLSQEYAACRDELLLMKREQATGGNMADRLAQLESKINGVTSRIDQTDVKHQLNFQMLEGRLTTSSQNPRAALVEDADGDSGWSNIEVTRHSTSQANQLADPAALDHLETRLVNYIDKEITFRNSKMDNLEQRLETALHRVETAGTGSPGTDQLIDSRLAITLIDSERNRDMAQLRTEIDNRFSQINKIVVQIQSEYDARLQLLEMDLRKQIEKLEKMAVVVY